MSTPLPTNPHDFALWLLDNLESPAPVGNSGLWEGTLPAEKDFDVIEAHLEDLPNHLAGASRADTRCIGFYPANADVYIDIEQLLANKNNRTRVPSHFTLRNFSFSYPPTNGDMESTPQPIAQYIDAVRLWGVFKNLADVNNGGLLFVSSHDAQLTILPEFHATDLAPLTAFNRFVAEFANEQTHTDQKRSIIRSVLIDQFRPKRSITFGEVLNRFEDIATNARHSLAMYMAEFSVAKVKSEVERQNLDDTLSLNKTLSDIQNQLLALPAAILLAGASISPDAVFRNYAVLVAVAVFTIFVKTLVSNQLHAIDAIGTQISHRKEKVSSMPVDSSAGILPLFTALELRVSQQRRTLRFISYVVFTVLALSALAVINVSHNGIIERFLGFDWAELTPWWAQIKMCLTKFGAQG
ncbi:hypothetical protein [Alcaligenes faecalis]|uniref:hypothetical protein n=1 Tax=Alcaligenes faecalis TaxID=511 RepID=UPI001C9B0DBA|nr:hypothetical protein [Alcaligenes faecalis]MBY6308670.1 hypothetical protein [Alcaligenes faecalis]MBY6316481.1 hypothetical protein [Alcaligenes faecalis]MBY6390312.1 hypothetical protein [Alcaligenes faecalis]